MKKIKIGILILFVFSLTACGNSNYIVDDEGKPVEYENTGQILQKDILCKPEGNRPCLGVSSRLWHVVQGAGAAIGPLFQG